NGAVNGAVSGAAAANVVSLEVVSKQPVAEGRVARTPARPDRRRLLGWPPGAHIALVLPNGCTRQYSLCGDRFDAHTYRIGVLREPGGRGGSAYVHDVLATGDLVGVGGPRNNFPLVPSGSYLFVAGGIGITPPPPMIHQAALLGADWRLLYGGRTRASMAFREELAAYPDRVQLVPQDEHGLLDLAAFLGAPREGVKVYCCGPAPLLAAAQRACAGWPPYTLHLERFVAAERAAPARPGPFTVELARAGVVVDGPPEASVLDAVRAAGVEVLSSCRQGICGTCETTVLSGRPDHRDAILADHERAANDCMFPCVSRSCDDRLVLDL